MVSIENLEVRARDTTKIRIGMFDRAGILVELSGEFDVRDLSTLRKVLSVVSSSGLSVCVDLSGVTFLDVRCARELAIRSHLYDHLVLGDLSWQAKSSFKSTVVELESSSILMGDRLAESRPAGTKEERDEVEPRKAPALAV